MFEIYGGIDPREVPTYTYEEVARFVGTRPSTVRTWVKGRPPAPRPGRTQDVGGLTRVTCDLVAPLNFYNFCELHVLSALRRHYRVPLRNIRRAVEYVRGHTDHAYPLIHAKFQTDGVDLFLHELGVVVNASRGGQLGMKDILSAYLHRIDFGQDGLATRLFPFLPAMGPEAPLEKMPRLVMVDPRVAFGRPVIAGTRVTTRILAERFQAGDTTVDMSEDYGITREVIEGAIAYETRLAA